MSDGKGNAGRTEAGDGKRRVTPTAQSVQEVFQMTSPQDNFNMMRSLFASAFGTPAPEDAPRKVTYAPFDVSITYSEEWAASDFIAELTEALTDVPEEHRATAKVKIEVESDYDGPSIVHLTLEYDAMETPEQVAERIAESAAARERDRAYRERQEREQFERLKAKFGSD